MDGPRYENILNWSKDDEAFVADVSEWPGCMPDVSTYGQALAAAEQAIADWIETARTTDRPIPEPRGRLLFA